MKQADKQGNNNKIGSLGENIVCRELRTKDFEIIEQNYLKPWGEIDIVARENNEIVFIEVKTVSYETYTTLADSVARETWRPEDNVHPDKLRRLGRTIKTWIDEHGYTGNWRFMVAVVKAVPREKFASVDFIEDVIPE